MIARPLVVFCDFDGTITEKDMVISICEKFCPPGWRTILEGILARTKTLKEGVAEMFSYIPSSRKEEVIRFGLETMQLRAGFEDFLKFCQDNGLRFIICSGGLDFFIEPLMAPYRSQIDKIYSIHTDFSKPMITLHHPYACETEGTCKVKVMDDYPGTLRILIGDSITDLHGARHAHLVFARSGLRKYLDEEKINYFPFETFYDVIHQLSQFNGPRHEKQAHVV